MQASQAPGKVVELCISKRAVLCSEENRKGRRLQRLAAGRRAGGWIEVTGAPRSDIPADGGWITTDAAGDVPWPRPEKVWLPSAVDPSAPGVAVAAGPGAAVKV